MELLPSSPSSSHLPLPLELHLLLSSSFPIPQQSLKPEWLLVAGEESQELASQDRRQLGVLEAVYPRPSSIPLDPCVSSDVQLAPSDDSKAVLIPIVAVEDDDAADQDAPPTPAPITVSSYFILPTTAVAPVPALPASHRSLPSSSLPPLPNLPPPQLPLPVASALGSDTSVKPDIAAAASAAFTAIMRSNEEGSLIDRDLLIKILRDPAMVGKLVSEHSARKQTPLPPAPPPPPPPTASGAINAAHLAPTPPPRFPSSSTSVLITLPTILPKAPPPPPPPPAKDANYYKSLIQKHGGEQQDPAEIRHEFGRKNHLGSVFVEGGGGREVRQSNGRKGKIEKLCVYFNTARGCREGSGCAYLHDSSPASRKKMERERGSKRIKFDR